MFPSKNVDSLLYLRSCRRGAGLARCPPCCEVGRRAKRAWTQSGGLCGRLSRARSQRARLEVAHDVQDAKDDRVDADQPDHGEQSDTGPEGDKNAEDDRCEPGQSQQPLAPSSQWECQGSYDLHDAGHNRPGRNQEEKDEGCDARPDKGDDACQNAQDALNQEQCPPPLMCKAQSSSCSKDPAYEGVRAKQVHQEEKRKRWPQQGHYAKQDGEDATKQKHSSIAPKSFLCDLHVVPPSIVESQRKNSVLKGVSSFKCQPAGFRSTTQLRRHALSTA